MRNESARLAHLKGLGLLDTPPEPAFDCLTSLAASVFAVKIALVSLVDAERQWFKSACGLDVRETPREHAFCAHAILGDDVMVVEDARKDPRFAENPLVTGEPHIRFYAGAALVTEKGHALGTLCVIDDRPRGFGPEDRRRLRHLGRAAVTAVELHRRNRQLAQALDAARFAAAIAERRAG